MNYKHSILETIGATPLIRLDHGEAAELFVKVEFFNPGGSIKDRAALSMLRAARAHGRLKRDTVVIEPTSGNTGVGLAMACAVEGVRLVIVMPDSMSVERRRLIAAYGAEIVLTPGALGMDGAVKNARVHGRHRRHAYRRRRISEKPHPLAQSRRGRTCRISAALRRQGRAAQDPGHWGQLCARCTEPLDHR